MLSLDQTVDLIAQKRNFGGLQWYFLCPALGVVASVLWKPPGAKRFCSREAWGKEVAYKTQFVGASRRAQIGKERIRDRLGSDNKCPTDWYLPLKPELMRTTTYQRHLGKYLRYEETLLKEKADWIARVKFD